MNSSDPYSKFEEKFCQEQAAMKRPTILVAGYTGTGKTSLIQAICGKEVVPDDRIGAGLPKTQCFDFYENPSIRFFDSKGLEAGESESTFIEGAQMFMRELQGDPIVDNHVHLMWYAIQGSGARVTPCDLRLVKELFPHVLVLITKNDITRPNQREALRDALLAGGIPEDRILFCSDQDQNSLKKIVTASLDLLPLAYRDAFMAAQIVDLEAKQTRAQYIIHGAAASAAAIGAVPIPVSDALLLAPLQLTMLASLAVLYKEPVEGLKTAFGSAIAESLGILTATSLTKLIPGLGSAINAAVASGLTEALGQLVNMYLKARLEARIHGLPMREIPISFEAMKNAFQSKTYR